MKEAKNLNLVIDGNYAFHKCLSVYFSPDEQAGLPKLTSEEDKAFYARKVLVDLCYAIRSFCNINLNSIIFTIDSRSWRKDIKIEENEGYKSNRKKSAEINWDGFYEVMNDVIEMLTNHGVYISKVKRAEGDDLMYLFANRFFQQNEDTIVMTGDKDMWQIATHNDENFIAIYVNNSKYSKVVITPEIHQRMERRLNGTLSIDEMTFAAAGYSNVMNLNKMINWTVQPQIVDPIKHAFLKVFIGDKGDGVPPSYSWITITKKHGNEKVNNFTEKRLVNIWNYMSNKYSGKDLIYNLENEMPFIHSEVNKISKGKLVEDGITPEQLKEKIKRNITLMYLDLTVIPEDIQEEFNAHFDKIFSKMKYVFSKFDANDFYIKKLVTDTKYGSASESTKADFFKEVKFDKDDFFSDENDKAKLI